MANLITNVNQACADFANIKRAITDKGIEVANGTPSSEYASKVKEVYEAGKKSEWDAFWDGFQDYGNRTNYNNAFAYTRLTDETFKPKYSIRPTSAYYMFFGCLEITDLKNLDVDLDLSQATDVRFMFYGMLDTNKGIGIKRIGVVDARSSTYGTTALQGMFNWDIYLEEVEKIILKDDGTQGLPDAFNSCNRLKEVRFEGVIGQNIVFADCPLSKASITSVINALSSTASGKTATFKKSAKEAAFTADEWAALIATKTNWTISLI